MRLSFLGLGTMGTPMALNLSRQFPVTIWNRSPSKCTPLRQKGLTIGETPAKVASQSDIIFTMLFDGPAVESILTPEFKSALRGKTLINTSSVTVECSHCLASQVHAVGVHFIEMPVSGSKVPVEQGRLVAADSCGRLLRADWIWAYDEVCGEPVSYYDDGGAGRVCESGERAGLDLKAFGRVLGAGSLVSLYSGLKVEKMVMGHWGAQETVRDCFNITELIRGATGEVDAEAPLIALCGELYGMAVEAGLEVKDMVAVMKVLSKEA
ncbi:hypothetical protein ETB97_010673 [Aspergillus alliaceus]|uniref:6-phosphogluconate dehydrogenase NADP-binding domain-containing protein n=2 Tax=Petromyces alliaceus TaxID=209559 RepID=A0A8H5ZV82_PETAA|nr:hypothetical protein ETB97_010673 [Aspergillus burnettii]